MPRIDPLEPVEMPDSILRYNVRTVAYMGSQPPKSDVPERFVLGKGHINFYKNKGLWLMKQHDKLFDEMDKRGLNTTVKKLNILHWPPECMNDWEPDKTAIALSLAKIAEKVSI
jgi:hypothetical protein